MSFLPTTVKEMRQLGWDYVDIVLFSGDAYIDHPSFGTAVVSRLFEDEGLRVAVVPQPNWRDDLRDFKKFGTPRLCFCVTLDLKILTYAIVCCGFSDFASLELHLFLYSCVGCPE